MKLASGNWLRKIIKQKGPGKPNPDYGPTWEQRRFEAEYRGQFQCDSSDRRAVNFPDGSKVETTSLLFGEFDILAAGLFMFREKWDFGFALNRDLPPSANPAYTAHQRERLITSMIPITWPLKTPFVSDIYELLDRLVIERNAAAAGQPVVNETKVIVKPPIVTTEVVEKVQVKIVEKKRKKKS